MTKLGPYDLNTIVTGDARELAKAIPDESVDFIICDPIYWQIQDYKWLASFAQRALVIGGNLIAQVGSEYRFEAEKAMRESDLIPLPLLAEIYDLSKGFFFKYRLSVGWKAHIWMSKGLRNGATMYDRVYSGRLNKSFHNWGDDGAFIDFCLNRLTNPNDIIVDPFTGSGVIPAMCKVLGRNYLAFEIDPDTADKARQRVEMTQPPLFVMQPEQLELMNI